MTDAIQCDRCGEFTIEIPVFVARLWSRAPGEEDKEHVASADLCSKCAAALHDFIDPQRERSR